MTPARTDAALARPGRPSLSDYPGAAVRVFCRRCGRESRHDLPRLLALFGARAELAQVLGRLAACDRQHDWLRDGPCWAVFTPLPAAAQPPLPAPRREVRLTAPRAAPGPAGVSGSAPSRPAGQGGWIPGRGATQP
jgi:hypothetical protein